MHCFCLGRQVPLQPDPHEKVFCITNHDTISIHRGQLISQLLHEVIQDSIATFKPSMVFLVLLVEDARPKEISVARIDILGNHRPPGILIDCRFPQPSTFIHVNLYRNAAGEFVQALVAEHRVYLIVDSVAGPKSSQKILKALKRV